MMTSVCLQYIKQLFTRAYKGYVPKQIRRTYVHICKVRNHTVVNMIAQMLRTKSLKQEKRADQQNIQNLILVCVQQFDAHHLQMIYNNRKVAWVILVWKMQSSFSPFISCNWIYIDSSMYMFVLYKPPEIFSSTTLVATHF